MVFVARKTQHRLLAQKGIVRSVHVSRTHIFVESPESLHDLVGGGNRLGRRQVAEHCIACVHQSDLLRRVTRSLYSAEYDSASDCDMSRPGELCRGGGDATSLPG